jgi:spermidine synthase
VIVDTESERQLRFSDHALQSRMRLDDPYALVAAYTRQMMSFLLFDPDPKHILLIGLGGGSLAKFCRRRLPYTRITVVEIDEGVIALRNSFHIPPDDRRFDVVHADGAHYLSMLNEQVDAILIDAFDEGGVSPSLMTERFFRDARRCLTHTGVMIMNLHGDPARFAPQLAHARAVFTTRMLLASVTNADNVLLCAFGEDAPSPSDKHLFLRARHLQSKLRLNFRIYLRRMREGEKLESALQRRC